MTNLLRHAFEQASKLPPEVQDEAAAHLLADIEAELRWEATLDETSESLSALADEALRDFHAGRTEPLDPDTL